MDDDKIGRMGFRTPPNHQDQAVGCQRRKNILTAVQFGYGRSGFGGYLGNVGLDMPDLRADRPRKRRGIARDGGCEAFRMRRLSFVLAAALTLFPITSSADTDTVTWMDDFLGIKYDQRYHASVAHGGDVKIASNPSIGGWLALVTDNTPESVARFRLGEDPKVSPYDAMPFSAGKNASGKARINVNMGQSIELTVGFVGRDDPDNVIAALYRPDEGWILQAKKNRGIDKDRVVANFWHVPGRTFVLEIRTTPNEAFLLIDGRIMAKTTIVTDSPLAWEFQIWNRPDSPTHWSSPALWVDYLRIEQDR